MDEKFGDVDTRHDPHLPPQAAGESRSLGGIHAVTGRRRPDHGAARPVKMGLCARRSVRKDDRHPQIAPWMVLVLGRPSRGAVSRLRRSGPPPPCHPAFGAVCTAAITCCLSQAVPEPRRGVAMKCTPVRVSQIAPPSKLTKPQARGSRLSCAHPHLWPAPRRRRRAKAAKRPCSWAHLCEGVVGEDGGGEEQAGGEVFEEEKRGEAGAVAGEVGIEHPASVSAACGAT